MMGLTSKRMENFHQFGILLVDVRRAWMLTYVNAACITSEGMDLSYQADGNIFKVYGKIQSGLITRENEYFCEIDG